MKKINENTKVTLTLGQIKRLVKESQCHLSNEDEVREFVKSMNFPHDDWHDYETELVDALTGRNTKDNAGWGAVYYNADKVLPFLKKFGMLGPRGVNQRQAISKLKKLFLSGAWKINENKNLVKESAEATNSLKDVAAFASKAMFFSVLVHFWHLNCDSNSQHLALKDLYESLDDNADKLLEAVIGQTGESIKITNPGFEFKGEFTEEAIGQIKAIKDEASKLEAAVEDNPGIANVLADIVEDCDSAIYKLTRLK